MLSESHFLPGEAFQSVLNKDSFLPEGNFCFLLLFDFLPNSQQNWILLAASSMSRALSVSWLFGGLWWSEVLLLSLSWEYTFSTHITIYSVHNLLPHVTALKFSDFKQGWISQWQPAMLWRRASPEGGSGWFPGTSSSRQAWLPEQTVWLLRGGVGSREAKPQTGAASADTGTHQTKGQASHSHTMWQSSHAGQPKWGAGPPTASSTDKIWHVKHPHPFQLTHWQRNSFTKWRACQSSKETSTPLFPLGKSKKFKCSLRISPIPLLFLGILLNGCTYIISNSPNNPTSLCEAPLSSF